MMDRPSTSQQSVEKIEVFEVREHVPYQQAEVTRAPTVYDEESGDMHSGSWDSAWNAICQLFNLLHHMLVAIVVFVLWHFALTSESNGAITNLSLHIVFAGTGYQFFLVESVLTLNKHNSWSAQMSADAKRIVHGCLQLIGSLFVIAGTFLGLARVDMAITSAHGICGVTALAFTIVSFVSGILALFSTKVHLRIKSKPMRIFHIGFGLIALTMGLICMTIGFNMDYFRTTRENLSIALMIFVPVITIYTIFQPIVDIVKMIRNL